MSCCFLANIWMGTIYLFAGKFSYIVLNKALCEKIVEMSTKQRQCRNDPDVFCYICGKYVMAKYRFNVRDFIKRAYVLWHEVRGPNLGHPTSCANNIQKLLDPRQSQFDVVWGSYGMA